MGIVRKVARTFYVSLTILVVCLLTALALASGIYFFEQAHAALSAIPHLAAGLEIVLLGLLVNCFCVVVLSQVAKAQKSTPQRPLFERLPLNGQSDLI